MTGLHKIITSPLRRDVLKAIRDWEAYRPMTFYYYSPEADRILEEDARRLGVKYYAETMPNHGPEPPGYRYDRTKNLYVKVEADA